MLHQKRNEKTVQGTHHKEADLKRLYEVTDVYIVIDISNLI